MLEDRVYNIQIRKLFCYFVEERGYDDVYLKFNDEKIWPPDKRQQPISMNTETELDIKLESVKGGSEVVIELWDWDLLSSDDLLGTFTLKVDVGGPYSTDMKRNPSETDKAKYSLEWEVY